MAEAEIIIKEDDDLLKQINLVGNKVRANKDANKQSLTSSLRPRGSAYSKKARARFPVENNAFDSCQHCHSPLAGCINKGAERVESNTNILTCAHVLCETCRDQCVKTQQEIADDRPLLQCPLCLEYGASNILPSPENVNLSACQAPYCSGEEFSSPQYRCVACQRHICEGCKVQHSEKFPEHELIPRCPITVNVNRPFTGCNAHQGPVTSRCQCGEMLCDHCPFNYTSFIPEKNQSVMHRKTRIEEVDMEVEDAMENTIGTVSRIRAMRSIAQQRKAELEETMDNVANEVALHFNQIIIQAIQRCFDVLKGLKNQGAKQHEAIEEHIKMLDKTERQLMMGVEMDERGRDSSLVAAESVSQYVRNVAYGLCKPAMEQFEESKQGNSFLEEVNFQLSILNPETRQIMEKIGKWGEKITTNLGDAKKPPQEIRLSPTPIIEAVSITGGARLRDILNDQSIVAADVPLRLHTALDHFTDLYERRFVNSSLRGMIVDTTGQTKREFPFQLGEREAPETRMNKQHMEERDVYEMYMQSRLGMYLMQPKIFGGFRRILNLSDHNDMTVKEVQGVYSRTPCVPPIWMGEGADPSEITPLKKNKDGEDGGVEGANHYVEYDEDARALGLVEAAEREEEGEMDGHSRHSTPDSTVGAEDEETTMQQPMDDQLQPLQQKQQPKIPAVLRKRNLVFVKKDDASAVTATASAASSTTATTTVTAMSTLPTAAIAAARKLTPLSFPPSAAKKTFFRPATTAERSAAAVTSPGGAAGTPRPTVVRPMISGMARVGPKPMGGSPHMNRFVRLVPATKLLTQDGVSRVVRDASGGMRVIRPVGANGTARVIGRPPTMGGGMMMRTGGGSHNQGDGRSTLFKSDDPMPGTSENTLSSLLAAQTEEEKVSDEKKRMQLRQRGFKETEIDKILVNHRTQRLEEERQEAELAQRKKERPLVLPRQRNLQYIVNPSRGQQMGGSLASASNVPVPRFGGARGAMADAQAVAGKRKMLPIERAFTSMFGADGSFLPEFNFRRRGRPAKDDPTAPSNILENFRKHTTTWPPKFDEMDDEEIAELQELIDQLDAASREEEEPHYANGIVKKEDSDELSLPILSSPWHSVPVDEREKMKAAAIEKLKGAKPEATKSGCFVCSLLREHEGKDRTWQCNECVRMGRDLTPMRDEDGGTPVSKKPKLMYNIVAPPLEEEPMMEDIESEEDEKVEEEEKKVEEQPRVERRGRKKKERKEEEPPGEVRMPRELRKRKETMVEVAQPEEEVVVGTTRSGRQIKMPSKLKGYESAPLVTPPISRRSPSTGCEGPSSSDAHVIGSATRSTTTKANKKKEKEKEEGGLKEFIKEESPEPTSEMDSPRKGRRGGK